MRIAFIQMATVYLRFGYRRKRLPTSAKDYEPCSEPALMS